jgi:hypothetical protein
LIDAAVANGAANPIRVEDFIDAADNTNVAGTAVMLQVTINNHQRNPATGTVGV